jgi:hypothetical protein
MMEVMLQAEQQILVAVEVAVANLLVLPMVLLALAAQAL